VAAIGAIRADHWLTLSTGWHAMTADRFVAWVTHQLIPRLRVGDSVIRDNLRAHTDARVGPAITRAGATLVYLPPDSSVFATRKPR